MSNVLAEDTTRVFDEIIQRNNFSGFPPPPKDGDGGRGGGGNGDGNSDPRWWRWVYRANRVIGYGFALIGACWVIGFTCQILGLIPTHP